MATFMSQPQPGSVSLRSRATRLDTVEHYISSAIGYVVLASVVVGGVLLVV